MSGSLLMEGCEVSGCYTGIRVGGKSHLALRSTKVHECRVGILVTDGSKGTMEDN